MDHRHLAEHLRFFSELGVTGVSRDPAWRSRAAGEPAPAPAPPPAAQETAAPAAASEELFQLVRSAEEALPAIRADLGDCTRCKLHRLGRRQIVFGVGNPSAELMFVGEAPGADEDAQGVPFVGRAGQMLTRMIEGMGYTRGDVYIANVVKCRPPENRNPAPDEIASCEPFLFRQIAAVRPKVIVALGAFAARALLRSESAISKLRGRVYDYHGAKLIATYHPSFLLRSPGYKREAWQDLKAAMALLGRQMPAGPPAPPPR